MNDKACIPAIICASCFLSSSCLCFLLVAGTVFSLGVSQQNSMLRKEIQHPLSEMAQEKLAHSAPRFSSHFLIPIGPIISKSNNPIPKPPGAHRVVTSPQKPTAIPCTKHKRWQNIHEHHTQATTTASSKSATRAFRHA